jgi:hypothetical protein
VPLFHGNEMMADKPKHCTVKQKARTNCVTSRGSVFYLRSLRTRTTNSSPLSHWNIVYS